MKLKEKPLIFVSGKGGVGKSTISLLLGKSLAQQGHSVLVVELGQKSSAGSLAKLPKSPEFSPQRTPFGFDIALVSGGQCLEDYIGHFIKLSSLTQVFFNNKVMKTLIPLAPGLEDLAILGKLTSQIRSHGPAFKYDKIIVDGFSTGTFLSMLKAPLHLSAMVKRGPLNHHSLEIHRALSDAQLCHYVFVTILERFPIDELRESTMEFSERMAGGFSVVVNKYLPEMNCSQLKNSNFKSFLLNRYKLQKKFLVQLKEEFPKLGTQAFLEQGLGEALESEGSCPNLVNL